MLLSERIFFLIFIIVFSSSILHSQNQFPTEQLPSDSKLAIVDPREFVIVSDIRVVGNKATKRHIILRELSFQISDTMQKSEIRKKLISAKENLLNTSLFNFVTVDTISDSSDRVNVLITVAERWYTWPIPIFEVQERNFNTWWQTKNFERANYGFYLNRENFRGRKEDLSFYFQFGYTEKYGISYKIPYLTKRQISGAGISFSYSRNREVAYMSMNNSLVFFKNPDDYVREEVMGKLNYTYRMGIYNRHFLEGRFTHAAIHDTIINYTMDYFLNNETEMQYFSLDYSFRSDHRDSKAYPLRGYYWELEVVQSGLGILTGEKIDVTNLFASLRNYRKLADRFYTSGSFRVKFSPNGNQPYYVQRGLGWSDYVRGYEYYVVDGQSYGTAKLGLRCEIVRPRVQTIPVMPLKKFTTFHYAFYAGIFGDAGYAYDLPYSTTNPLANTLLYGYGIGIDYVTYYDLVLRLEYSFNRRMEHGFFVNFNAGI